MIHYKKLSNLLISIAKLAMPIDEHLAHKIIIALLLVQSLNFKQQLLLHIKVYLVIIYLRAIKR